MAENPLLQATPNPLLCVAGGHVTEAEIDRLPHLQGDARRASRNRKAELRENRQAKIAAEAIGSIPADGDAIHMVISGRFALWDFVPAILSLSGSRINALTIATLGFSKRNITQMKDFVEADRIGSVRLLFSHYFRGTSAIITNYADEIFAEASSRMQLLSVRTHAKVMLMALADGRRLTFESSANLRSCRNIEQVTAIGGHAVYDFHKEWIDSLFRPSEGL